MKISVSCFVVHLLLAAHSIDGTGQDGSIFITVTNIRSETGIIRIALYDHEDQFPHDPARSFRFAKSLVKKDSLEIILADIPHGTYVISLLDDEDENDRMKFNLLRMPKEGYGFSKNIRPGLKSPSFEECSFTVGEENVYLQIEVQYFREKS